MIAQFQLEVRVNEAVQEARAKINAVRGDLPAAIQEPVIQKFDVAAMPIISLAARSDDALAAGALDLGRQEAQAAPREHQRRRQDRPGGPRQARSLGRTRPGAPRGAGPGRGRGLGRAALGERQHAARAPAPRRDRSPAADLRQARVRRGLRGHGHRRSRRPPGDPRGRGARARRHRGAAHAGLHRRRRGGGDRRAQAVRRQHRGGDRRGQGRARESASARCRPASA